MSTEKWLKIQDLMIIHTGANDIVIELQEIKGSSGTQNVILGEFEASKSQKGKEF